MKRKKAIVLLYGLLAMVACKEKYVAHTNYPYTGYLVVDGFINAGNGDSTEIRLSRTTALDSAFYRAETGAVVTVESSDNQAWPLPGNDNGLYSAAIPVNASMEYRLRISSGGREYLSDFVPARITPAIDSIHWEEQPTGVQIDVSSHDPDGKTVYYKWGFSETWKYSARYSSTLIYENGNMDYRADSQQIYYCWKTDTGSDILLASTAKLSQDVAANQPLTFIPFSTPFNKLIMKYSILVTEAALTEDEYEWYDRLKKNTESLGSIFDAQPSEIGGNIHSLSDSAETVIGYVGCRTQTSGRIFISRAQLAVKTLSTGDAFCEVDTVNGVSAAALAKAFGGGNFVPLEYVSSRSTITGVAVATPACADCRAKGGVTTKPPFWID